MLRKFWITEGHLYLYTNLIKPTSLTKCSNLTVITQSVSGNILVVRITGDPLYICTIHTTDLNNKCFWLISS